MKYLFICILMISFIPVFAQEPGAIHFHGGVQPNTDSVYRGKTLEFSGWANAYQDWGSGLIEVPNSTFDVSIINPHGKTIFQNTFTGDQKSAIHFTLPITSDFEFGMYLVKFSISKEGYETYSEDQRYFFVQRTLDDIVPAKNYELNLWTNQTKVNYQSNTQLFTRFCLQNPPILDPAGFSDPESLEVIDQPRYLHTISITKPDGTKTTSGAGWNDLECDKTYENSFSGQMEGNWTIQYGVKWFSNGTVYGAKSNTIQISVEEPAFHTKLHKIANITNVWGGFDWSSDGKFVIFTKNDALPQTSNVQYLMTVNPDGKNLKKLDLAKVFSYIESPRISPSNDDVLFFGSYYVDDTFQKTSFGLFSYNIKNDKLYQIETSDIASIERFGWTQDNNIAYVKDIWDETTHNLDKKLVITDTEGTELRTIDDERKFNEMSLIHEPNQIGNLIVNTETYRYTQGGRITLKSSDESFQQILFDSIRMTPTSSALSPDGKFIVFGTPTESYDVPNVPGIYLIELDKPVSTIQTFQKPITTSFVGNDLVEPKTDITFSTPVNLSDDRKSQNPRIVSSGNNVYLVWEDFESGNNDIYFKKSTDGGKTFDNTINLSNNDGRSYDPQIVVSGNNVYVVWSDESRGRPISTIANTNTMFVKSTDGGLTFSIPKNLSIKNVYSQATVNWSPKIAVSGNNVYVIWIVSNYSWVNVFLTTSNDNGNIFGDPINVSNNDKTNIAQLPGITASDKGVFVIWQDYFNNSRDPPYGYIKLAKSTDGKTFDIQKLSDNDGAEGRSSTEPHVYANGDNVYALWRDEVQKNGITFAKRSDAGNTFSKKYLGYAGGLASDRTWVVKADGSQYVVWTDGKDIFFIKSTDGGLTFSNPINLSNNTWNLNPYDEIPIPQLAVLGNNVYVTWKYTIAPDGNHAPFFVASSDGGDSFSEPVRLSQSAGDSREIPQIMASENHVYVVYSDTIPAGSDIFLVKGTSPQTILEESEKSPTENNSSGNIFEQLLNWIKQIFHL